MTTDNSRCWEHPVKHKRESKQELADSGSCHWRLSPALHYMQFAIKYHSLASKRSNLNLDVPSKHCQLGRPQRRSRTLRKTLPLWENTCHVTSNSSVESSGSCVLVQPHHKFSTFLLITERLDGSCCVSHRYSCRKKWLDLCCANDSAFALGDVITMHPSHLRQSRPRAIAHCVCSEGIIVMLF